MVQVVEGKKIAGANDGCSVPGQQKAPEKRKSHLREQVAFSALIICLVKK
jgi:hypothetical protein